MGFKVTVDSIIENGNMTGDLTSGPLDASSIYALGIFAKYDGSPSGSLIFEGSANKVDWFELETATTITAAGNNGSEFKDYPWKWIRVRYVFSSGTGTLNVWLNSKGV